MGVEELKQVQMCTIDATDCLHHAEKGKWTTAVNYFGVHR